jgi:frataxin-like iron-binding protein CyaY
MKKEKENLFTLSLGDGNEVLPGEIYDVFTAKVSLDSADFVSTKGEHFSLAFPTISAASFSDYIYQQNLWFSCVADGKRYCFCASPKEWKSSSGKKLLERIGHYTKIANTKALDLYLHDGPTDVIMNLLLS